MAQTGHPSAVRSLRAHARNQEVHLFWDTPAIVTGGEDDSFVFQYEYRQKAGSGAWGAWTATPQSPPSSGATLKGFDNGTEYSFQVRAKNRHKRVGPDGRTVTATPNPTYRASLCRWGIRRGGDPTEATLTVSNGPFREARTYTIEWNGQPTDQGLLHSGNATSVTLPAGDIDIAVITEAPERIWVWSDLHLGDQTAHRIWNRPEASARALSERMLQEWERSVGAHDLMLCLGDVAHPFLLTDMEATARIRAAPGRRVLVVGNHDVHRRRMLVRAGFDDMYVAAVHAGEPRLVFSHPPLPSIPGGGINVHGHLHRRSAPSPRHWNVSVERLGYRPVRLDRLIAENGTVR